MYNHRRIHRIINAFIIIIIADYYSVFNGGPRFIYLSCRITWCNNKDITF